MNLTWKIAWRYLIAKRSTNAIHVITGISIFGLGFGAAALILILSVFNGFETLLLQMYSNFHPDIQITAKKGKNFDFDQGAFSALSKLESLDAVSLCLEELALFEFEDRQEVGTLKGVDSVFKQVSQLDAKITHGRYITQDQGIAHGVFGLGMSYKLGLSVHDRLSSVAVYLLNPNPTSLSDQQFTAANLYPAGTFAIQQEVDYEYVIAPLDLVQKISKNPGKISSYEIKIKPGYDTQKTINEIKNILGPDFDIKNRIEQQSATIRVMRIEKWLSFIILLLALVLVAFNLIGAIWMIVLDKKHDLAILQAMGAKKSMIRMLIIKLGVLICSIGFGIGLFVALLFYALHKKFGIIRMGPQAIVDNYPMQLYWSDLPVVAGMVFVIGILSIWLPARQAQTSYSIPKTA